MGKAHNSFMATRKNPSTKMTPNISTEPDTQDGGGQNCPMPTVETVEAFVAEVQDAPPSSITIAVGTAGYYTGARPAETLAQYKTRLGTTYGTFGDLGTMLGTAPKA